LDYRLAQQAHRARGVALGQSKGAERSQRIGVAGLELDGARQRALRLIGVPGAQCGHAKRDERVGMLGCYLGCATEQTPGLLQATLVAVHHAQVVEDVEVIRLDWQERFEHGPGIGVLPRLE